MSGLLKPDKFQKLAWGMKRDKDEQIHKDMRKMMQFDMMMKYGTSPMAPHSANTGNPSTVMTSPTMSSSVTSAQSFPPPATLQNELNSAFQELTKEERNYTLYVIIN